MRSELLRRSARSRTGDFSGQIAAVLFPLVILVAAAGVQPTGAIPQSQIIHSFSTYDWPMLQHDPLHSGFVPMPTPLEDHKLSSAGVAGAVKGSIAAWDGRIYVAASALVYSMNST